jgi:hypothetical protein
MRFMEAGIKICCKPRICNAPYQTPSGSEDCIPQNCE